MLILAAGLLAEAAAAKPAATTCGAPGKPPCPLQAFMRTHAAGPVASKDYAKLAQTFETIAKHNPDPAKWGNWTKIANDGALAAREGRESGVRAGCGRCHRAYRRAYNARYRELAVSP